MYIKGLTRSQVWECLELTNKKVGGSNLRFNREPERVSKNWIRCTIRVKDSKGKFAKRGFSGRRTCSACWHGHGYFMDTLIELGADIVKTRGGQKHVGGQWNDFNCGSIMNPMYASEMCDCE
jgi:hypothetical protein